MTARRAVVVGVAYAVRPWLQWLVYGIYSTPIVWVFVPIGVAVVAYFGVSFESQVANRPLGIALGVVVVAILLAFAVRAPKGRRLRPPSESDHRLEPVLARRTAPGGGRQREHQSRGRKARAERVGGGDHGSIWKPVGVDRTRAERHDGGGIVLGRAKGINRWPGKGRPTSQ